MYILNKIISCVWALSIIASTSMADVVEETNEQAIKVVQDHSNDSWLKIEKNVRDSNMSEPVVTKATLKNDNNESVKNRSAIVWGMAIQENSTQEESNICFSTNNDRTWCVKWEVTFYYMPNWDIEVYDIKWDLVKIILWNKLCK